MAIMDNSAQPNRLLIIDDESDVRLFLRDVAEEMVYAVAEASDHASFANQYESFQPTVIILDLTLPGMDGIEFLRDLANRGCEAPVILSSGQDERVLNTAQRLGRMLGLDVDIVLPKPVSLVDLERALDGARRDAARVTPQTLRHAIENEELIMYFQPKIDLGLSEGVSVAGSEALMRWACPHHGLVPPGEFIPLAEETGLIEPLTELMLRQTIAQIASWNQQGLYLPVSINLSPKQLTDLTLPDRISALLKTAGVDSSQLVVEVTEQAAMADVGKATEILTRLRLKNIDVSLDDFGSGYSSLVEIYRMPLSELKLDQSLIADTDIDADARVVVRALVALAKELRLPVCAEGIETEKTAQFVRSIGCAKAQGYYFAKPMPADEFFQFVHENTVVQTRKVS